MTGSYGDIAIWLIGTESPYPSGPNEDLHLIALVV